MAAVCCVMVACVGTFSAVNLLSPDDVIAGKNDPVMTEEGNNTIVKEGQGQSGENTGTEKITVNDWEKVSYVKKKYPQLLIPQYVPEGFEFTGLEIEETEIFSTYTYTYVQGEKSLKLTQVVGTDLEIINDYDRNFETEGGVAVKLKEDIEISANFIIERSLCTLIGSFSDEECGKIVDALER